VGFCEHSDELLGPIKKGYILTSCVIIHFPNNILHACTRAGRQAKNVDAAFQLDPYIGLTVKGGGPYCVLITWKADASKYYSSHTGECNKVTQAGILSVTVKCRLFFSSYALLM
jgi:hypothetical protein